MKKRYSGNADKSKKGLLRSNNTYVALFALVFVVLVFISVCNPDTSSKDNLLTAEKSAEMLDKRLQNADKIEENITNSYARLAAKRSDVCPKLIQEEVGRQVIERDAEVMIDNHCDYFLYPREGQKISVSVNNSQVEALLIVPMLHNFANGNYQVESYDKHVIRLAYKGATYKPKKFVYDVAVTVAS